MEGKLAFNVKDTRADYFNGVMRIFAIVELHEKGMTSVNQVWQVGSSVSVDGFLVKHAFQPANLGAKGQLDLLSGQSISGPSGGIGGGDSRTKKRNIHGILNAVSWGILFPVGVIIVRYLRTFPSADVTWFYLHAFCKFLLMQSTSPVGPWDLNLDPSQRVSPTTLTAISGLLYFLLQQSSFAFDAMFANIKLRSDGRSGKASPLPIGDFKVNAFYVYDMKKYCR
ncbi:unnamed protein product [Lactuca virosa]|uniref:AIR12 DOMON domain-containing protein n=1 Tax=Lactuca virosa TaxID=75947 RepID=A0AAU9N3D9_9ASTR|nr:unnamed protein product [Lactuca virosa]